MVRSRRLLREMVRRLTGRWAVYLERPLPPDELGTARQAGSLPSFGFFLLLSCAAVLACLGLLADSAAIIIGAMIIAPLMNPILSLAFAVVAGDLTLYKRSLLTVVAGTLVTIGISGGITLLLPFYVGGAEIISRTSPTFIDAVVALVAGVAGAFSLTRRSIANSIAGVAIAVALVPPLCVVGIGLARGESLAGELGTIDLSGTAVASGALVLFASNIVGIVFGAMAVFMSQRYGRSSGLITVVLAFLVGLAVLYLPLSRGFREALIASRARLELQRIRDENPGFSSRTQIRYVKSSVSKGRVQLSLGITSPPGLVDDSYLKARSKELLESLRPLGVTGLSLEVRLIPVEVMRFATDEPSR
ncbi:DUF389 domain-containing protein [Synechococcus sp. RSCCF101]|uniref:DUF389 domain-containing protein n=1 Tax=Synechococcus sp. RSCCF101 TaxID=2511069 RepID=UPI00178063E3|nr:DUF389 domain-containing protein [Synechococcus sp. RSCCF101]